MLFNTLEFLFVFFPAMLVLYHIVRRTLGHGAGLVILNVGSLIFYGWWDVRYLPLLIGSAIVNYALALPLRGGGRQGLLAFGVAANLITLGVFKYADFLIGNLNAAPGLDFALPGLELPLAISFFTFQQIAFLVDVSAGRTQPTTLSRHLAFVAFFPQLIAGPIVSHRLMGPQLADAGRRDDLASDLSIGLSIFTIGLAKKVLIAENAAPFASSVFGAAARGETIGLIDGWVGALAYSIQIFFDFSGYSDMAIGLARCFGYRLPINFNAPYKATDIADFWRRWHITLSQFLRDYLYIPLGGSRKGAARTALNLMLVMLLGGLWHGAAWTFVVWGGLHGLGLAFSHQMRRLFPGGLFPLALRPLAVVSTFIFVTIVWVFFRADSFPAAWAVLSGMFGVNGIGAPADDSALAVIVIGLALVWGAPDTARLFRNTFSDEALKLAEIHRTKGVAWAPRAWLAGVTAVLLFLAVINSWTTSEFIYYTF